MADNRIQYETTRESVSMVAGTSDYSYTIKGDSVTIAGYRGGASEVIIPASIDGHPVRTIGRGAFKNNAGLRSVTVPEGVIRIEESAFEGCSGLSQIRLPGSLMNVGARAFKGCAALKRIALPDRVDRLSMEILCGCANLEELRLSDRVSMCQDGAFAGCKSLRHVTLPAGMLLKNRTPFEGSALEPFYDDIRGCLFNRRPFVLENGQNASGEIVKRSSFTSGDFGYDLDNGNAVITEYRGAGGDVTVPESIDGHPVNSIGRQAFRGCENVRSVTLPDCIETINSEAFAFCTNMTSIRLPAQMPGVKMGQRVFANCTALKSVTMPAGMISVVSETFCGCVGLEEISLPDSCEGYGSGAFYGCKGLKRVTLPAMKQLSGSAFDGSPLEGELKAIQACARAGKPFVFEGGRSATPVPEEKPRPLSEIKDDALAPKYALGNGLVLENEKRLLSRKAYDPAKKIHRFRDVMFGGEIVVQEMPDGVPGRSDEALVKERIGALIMQGLGPFDGRVQTHESISYGIRKRGDGVSVSIVALDGHVLLVVGSVAAIVIHLYSTGAARPSIPEEPSVREEKTIMQLLLDGIRGWFR